MFYSSNAVCCRDDIIVFSVLLQVLESVGFVNVRAEDRTDLFVASLKRELKEATSIRTEFIQVLAFHQCNTSEKIFVHYRVRLGYRVYFRGEPERNCT